MKLYILEYHDHNRENYEDQDNNWVSIFANKETAILRARELAKEVEEKNLSHREKTGYYWGGKQYFVTEIEEGEEQDSGKVIYESRDWNEADEDE